MTGRITNLFVKPRHGAAMRSATSAQAVAGKGLRDDVSFGREKRQILVIENETLHEFGLLVGAVRENVTVEGLRLAGLPAGTHLRMGSVLLEVTMDCAPCEFIEGMRPGLQAAMQGRRGTLFRVLEGGELNVGDSIAVLMPELEP